MNKEQLDQLLETPFSWNSRCSMTKYLSRHSCVKFALFCAKQVQHLTTLKEAHRAIQIAELWLENKATKEDCKDAANAADNAIYCAIEAIAESDLTKVELYKQEQVSYLKQLIIDELPEELKDNWLLVASI